MILRFVLLLIAVSGLRVAAQSTWTVATWNTAAGGELQSDSTGALILGNVDPRTNLALQKTAVDHAGATPRITDGNTTRNSAWNSLREEAFNFFVQIDLEEPRLVNRVVIIPIDGDEGATDFLKGYSLQTSLDNIVFKEQVLNTRNLNKLIDTTFAAVVARYVRVQVKAVDNVHKVQMGELEVYGEGFLSAGSFEAEVTDFGVRNAKNFGQVRWEGDVPEGTSLTLQVRTGPTATPGDSWSEWTKPTPAKDVLIELPEPQRYLQFRVNLATADPELTPRLSQIAVGYGEPLATAVTGKVTRDDEGVVEPDTLALNEAPVGQQRRFLYRVRAQVGTSSGFDILRLKMPNRVQVEQVRMGGATLVAGTDYTLAGDTTNVDIRFARRVTSDVTVEVRFSAVLFDELNVFGGQVIDRANLENPQEMVADSDGALVIFGVGLIDKVLDKTRITVAPNPFSPDGDGRFDKVQFHYELAKLGIPQSVTLRIFDLTGRPLRQVELAQKSGTHLLEWDGRDDEGKIVPPGLYLFQIEVDSGEGAVFNGAIGVSY